MGSCLSSDSGGSTSCGSSSSSSMLSSPPLSPASKKAKKGWRRKRQGSTSSFGSRTSEEQHLHRIPGRMFLNGASNAASLFSQQGKKGTNQDAMIVWENFCSRTDTVFCGVFDGHGPYGHLVARTVRDSLPLKLSAHWEVSIASDDFITESSISTTGSMKSEDPAHAYLDKESRASVDLEDKEKHPEIFTILKESFLKAFKVMDKELKLHNHINCFCSGTTAVTLVKQGQDLVIGNVGDSRAIMGTRDQNDNLTAIQLTVDLKPNLPREAERIKRCKGRVFALHDEPEVSRIWLPNNDSPGLAMARAFGDFCLKDFGLISVPEIFYRHLSEQDEFIVLATDGVWDVLSNKEVVDIVASAPDRSSAARSIVESAVRAWRFKYPTSKIDDCAVVCLFLRNNSDSDYAAAAPIKDDTSDLKITETQRACSNDDNMQNTQEFCSEILPEVDKGKGKGMGGGSRSEVRSISQHQTSDGNLDAEIEDDEWSALQGVSRVNTLLTLPRYSVKGDKKPACPKGKK